MGNNLLSNYGQVVAMILFVIGFANLLLNKNLIKKIIGFNIMDSAVYLFLAEMGYIKGRTVPIMQNGVQDFSAYINPIPAGLVLTGIVVGKMAVLAEGDAANRDDIIFLEKLPLFDPEGNPLD